MVSMRNPKLTFVVNAIEVAGGTVPKPIANAIKDVDRINKEIHKHHSGNGYIDMATAWANAVLAGRDPAEDREVVRAVLINSLVSEGDLEYAARNAIENRTIDGLIACQGQILKQFKNAFDNAGRTLQNSHSILGETALDDTTTIFQLGPAAVQAYQDAKEAVRVARIISAGWDALNSLTQFAGRVKEHATWWTDADPDTWARVRRTKDAWEMTRAGASLNLAIDAETIKARQERRGSDET